MELRHPCPANVASLLGCLHVAGHGRREEDEKGNWRRAPFPLLNPLYEESEVLRGGRCHDMVIREGSEGSEDG